MNLPFLRRRPTPADLPPVRVIKPGPEPSRAEFTLPPTPGGRGPRFLPGRYVVAYDRLGQHTVPPLTVWAMSAADLAAHIRTDVEPYLGTDRAAVTVDTVVSGGVITAGSVSGTFTYTRGGAQ